MYSDRMPNVLKHPQDLPVPAMAEFAEFFRHCQQLRRPSFFHDEAKSCNACVPIMFQDLRGSTAKVQGEHRPQNQYCQYSSSKKLLVTSVLLLVTSALLLVGRQHHISCSTVTQVTTGSPMREQSGSSGAAPPALPKEDKAALHPAASSLSEEPGFERTTTSSKRRWWHQFTILHHFTEKFMSLLWRFRNDYDLVRW